MTSVEISRKVINQMIEHAQREHPIECCGLLYGSGEFIDGVRFARNEKQSNREFSVSPKDLLEFFKELRANGKNHLGIYHSHPSSGPYPSAQDVIEFHYPEVSYWIISLEKYKPRVRCFRWAENSFQEVAFNVVEK